MKTKKSKRLFAALLSLVMVISTFAAMPFSSFASTYTLDDLNTLMSQYETKMQNGKVYKNLPEAYDAWYDAYITYVGVKAGKTADTQIDTAYTNLQAQINSMTDDNVWTPTQITSKVPSFAANNVSGTLPTAYYHNILYTEAGTSNAAATMAEKAYLNLAVYYPTTVLLYDGTDPIMGVQFGGYNSYRSLTGSQPRYVYSMYPTTGANSETVNTDFTLVGPWKGACASDGDGSTGYLDWGYAMTNSACTSKVGIDKVNGYSSILFEKLKYSGSVKHYKGYGNALKFNGLADNVYTKSYNLNWRYYAGSKETVTWTDKNLAGINATAGTTIYVVNYNAIISKINSAINNLITNKITDYSYSTAKALLTAIDNAQNYNPATRFSSSTSSSVSGDVNNANTDISGYISAINNAQAGLVSINKASYVSYAEHYAAYKTLADGNNSNGYYTTESFGTFKTAHDQAGTDLDAIINKSAYMTNISSADTALTNAYKNLVAAESYIDDTELKAYISQYYQLTKSYYTTSTYDALTAKVNAALFYYNDGSYTAGITLKDNETDTAIYNTLLKDIKAATAALDISRDAVVAVDGELTSYNALITEANAVDGSKYSNYSAVMEKVGEASVAIVALENSDFTSEAEMITTYAAVLKTANDALDSLTLAFTALADGTIVSTDYGSTSGFNQDNVTVYLSNAITQRTYFKTTTETSNYVTEYDITVDNKWEYASSHKGAQFHGLAFAQAGNDLYKTNDGKMTLLWKEGGAAKSGTFNTANYTYHTALMKSPSNYTAGQDYIDIVKNTTNQKILGETTVTPNATTPAAGSEVYSVSWTTPDLYEFFYINNKVKEVSANTDCKQTVTVIDISRLIEKVNEAAAIVNACESNAFNCYTAASWSAFTTALSEAQANFAYTSMTNADIVTACQARYNNLVSAINGLTKNTADGAHNLVEQADSVHATCTVDGSLHYICSVCGYDTTKPDPATGHDMSVYTPNNDGLTHTISCTKGDNSVVEKCTAGADNRCTVCGQTLYTPADWTVYNNAKAEMQAALQASVDGTAKYSVAALQQANTDIAALSFYNYDAAQQAAFPDTRQSEINAQAAEVSAAAEALRNGIADSSVYDANASKASTLNADAYNVANVQSAVSGISVTQTVSVNGSDYTGYDYDNYNTAFATALTENWIPYTVTVYDFDGNSFYLTETDGVFGYTEDSASATQFHYGDYVTAKNPNDETAACDWRVFVYTDNNPNGSINKYMLNDTDYIFNVRGNTEIETTAAATDNSANKQVKFVLLLDGVNTGKVLDVQYTSRTLSFANCNLPDNIPYYAKSEIYSLAADGTKTAYALTGAKAKITPTENTVVYVNYESTAPASYTITLVNENGDILKTVPAVFNEYVTLSASGAASYINNENGKTLCFGSEYSFYACRDITVKALSTAASTASADVIATPVLDSDQSKVYIVGSFALPEGCTIQSFGIVFDALASKSNLSLADVSSANYVANLSASKYTCGGQRGNQFTVSFNQNSDVYPVGNYVAYAIYTDANGITQYVYSDVVVRANLVG